MNPTAVNLISALTITCIISLMAVLKNAQAKALVYSLPIPITVALLATGGEVISSTYTGLVLANLFVWGMFYLYGVRGWPILFSDVLLAFSYVIASYALSRAFAPPLFVVTLIVPLLWWTFMLATRNQILESNTMKPAQLSGWSKGGIVFILAYFLFAIKGYLPGFVVLFPFSGIFAVYEGRDILKSLAMVFSRNSIAIWAFLLADHVLAKSAGRWTGLLIAWCVYLLILLIATKLFPLRYEVMESSE